MFGGFWFLRGPENGLNMSIMSNSKRHNISSAPANKTQTGVTTGPFNNITDVSGIGVGHAQDDTAKTGVTVILPDNAWTCAVDVRGGGPGTRETDLLDPSTLVNAVDAIVLSGGSSYGLAAADAVTAQLGAQNRGFSLMAQTGVPPSPIVPAAILYDLANGGDKDWGANPPYHQLGLNAFQHCEGSSEIPQGKVGAGYGAKAGQEQGGVGSVSLIDGDLTIGALIAVNSFGSVRMPGSNAFWAWPFEMSHEGKSEFGAIKPAANFQGASGYPDDTKLGPVNGPKQNTTIGVIAISQALSQSEARRIAIMAQDGMARAIRPVHAPTDGDVLFILAPPPKNGTNPLDPVPLTRIGNGAADCVARAIARGVYEANQ